MDNDSLSSLPWFTDLEIDALQAFNPFAQAMLKEFPTAAQRHVQQCRAGGGDVNEIRHWIMVLLVSVEVRPSSLPIWDGTDHCRCRR